MSRPPLNWGLTLAGLKKDRAQPADIRFERLNTTAGLRTSPPVALGGWRGKSGRRYVVALHDLSLDMAVDALPAVLIAVRPDAISTSGIVDLFSGDTATNLPEWIARAQALGATGLHIHRLAVDAAERVAIVRDLTAPFAAVA